MINTLIDIAGQKFRQATEGGALSFVKEIRYGNLGFENVTLTPSLVYSFLGAEDVRHEGERFMISYRFGFYVCTAETINQDEALKDCQKLFWYYESERDKGVMPWYLTQRQRIWHKDSQKRLWRFEYEETPKMYAAAKGSNIVGSIYAEFLLSSRIDSILG